MRRIIKIYNYIDPNTSKHYIVSNCINCGDIKRKRIPFYSVLPDDYFNENI